MADGLADRLSHWRCLPAFRAGQLHESAAIRTVSIRINPLRFYRHALSPPRRIGAKRFSRSAISNEKDRRVRKSQKGKFLPKLPKRSLRSAIIADSHRGRRLPIRGSPAVHEKKPSNMKRPSDDADGLSIRRFRSGCRMLAARALLEERAQDAGEQTALMRALRNRRGGGGLDGHGGRRLLGCGIRCRRGGRGGRGSRLRRL